MRVAIIALGLALAAGVAQAQDRSCPAATQAWVLRTSRIKPGQEATFHKAMLDQEAWYRSKGITTNAFKAGQVVTTDGPDASTVVTVHMNAPAARPGNDDAWNAFVAEYRASSDMLSETYACLGDIR